MNFTQLNWAGWILLILQVISILLGPLAMGREQENYTYANFFWAVVALILLVIALKII